VVGDIQCYWLCLPALAVSSVVAGCRVLLLLLLLQDDYLLLLAVGQGVILLIVTANVEDDFGVEKGHVGRQLLHVAVAVFSLVVVLFRWRGNG